MSPSTTRRTAAAALVAAFLTFGLAACGDDGTEPGGGSGSGSGSGSE